MTVDRRAEERCPVCKGPTRKTENNQIACRNSLCSFNHREVTCPRCHQKEAEATQYSDGAFQYVCRNCQNSWQG